MSQKPSREALLAERAELRQEIDSLKTEKADLEMMMEMSTEHSDHLEEELLDKVESTLRESEKRFRLITETIPVPLIISRVPGSAIVYANQPASSMLELPIETLLKRKAVEFYDHADRQSLSDTLADQGYVSNYELKGRKADGTPFWVALFIQPLRFNDEPCLLTVWYDLTDQRQAEEEIRRLSEELERREREKEGKYLTFTLADEDYGISILKVREIIGMMPVISVPRTPDFIKGVINLRDRVIPVTDLRLRFGLESSDYTDRTCIIVTEIVDKIEDDVKSVAGLVVDSVSEVLNIQGKVIEDVPETGLGLNTDYILGMAKVNGKVKILINIDNVFDAGETDVLERLKDRKRLNSA